MKKSQLQNIRNCVSVLLLVSMAIPCVLEAKREKRVRGQHKQIEAVYEDAQSTRQEMAKKLQHQFKQFQKTLKWFRDCLVDGNCTPEERVKVVDMANNLLKLSLLAVGVGIVQTGEYVIKGVEYLRGQ